MGSSEGARGDWPDAGWLQSRHDVAASRRPAFRAVADDLKARVADGTLVAGSVLPPELELARHYGVSRGTVREALRILSTQGLIVTRRGTRGGSFVTEGAPESDERPHRLTLSVVEPNVGVPEIIATRALFDVPSARDAARRRTTDDLFFLRTALDVPYDGLVQSDSFELHWKFHSALYRIAGNPLITALAYPLAIFAQENHFSRYSKESAGKSHADHEEIFSAIADRDVLSAEVGMIHHLERLEIVHGKTA
jgi:DNA-binding FadR family transcriptional regulator